MIKTFKCKETQKIFRRQYSTKLPSDIQNAAFRKLRMINRSYTLNDLKVPPANRLEMLAGKRKGQYSIRINDQWRICFRWIDNNALDVEITDYHWGNKMRNNKIPSLHPGVVLFEEFLKPLKISQNQLGRDLGVSARRINEIVHGKRSVTANTALRLARYFGNSPQFWLGLQVDYDLDVETDRLSNRIEREVKKLAYA
jgi:proteic killer suppression protein